MMMNNRLILAAGLLLAVGGITGCSPAQTKVDGRAKVSVQMAVIADIQSVRVSVDDAGALPAFAAFDLLLTRAPAGNVWTGNINQIPANPTPGSLRRFKAEAFNGAGTKLYEGDSLATVIAGQTAEVTIILQELNVPPGPVNFAPVITSLTSTAAYVLPGQTGASTVVASDPDNNGNPLQYAWSATCTGGGTLTLVPNLNRVTWTAPAVNSLCTVAIRVSESTIAQPLSVTTYFTIEVNANFGNANVAAFPNSFPIVTARGDFRYNYFADVTTIPVGQQGDLFFTALDPDGDNVRFALSARCGATLASAVAIPGTFFSATASNTAAGGAFAFSPTFGHPAPVPTYTVTADDCEFRVDVRDLCTNGNCGAAGAQGSLVDGADKVTTINGVTVASVTTGFINATHPAQAQRAPVIVRTVAPNQLGGAAVGVQSWDPQQLAVVQPGAAYLLQVEADDRFELGTLSAAWSCNAGSVFLVSNTPSGTPSGKVLKSVVSWVAPAALVVNMACTVTMTSGVSSLGTVATFQFAGSDPCVGATDGTACNDGNACTTGESCQASVCTPASTVTCTALDACHVPGLCDTNTGVCSNPNAPNGTACTDANACTSGDVCSAGTCAAGTATVCTASGQCFDAGVCNPATGVCSSPASPTGTACINADLCTLNDACNGAGTCVDGTTTVSCAVGECIAVAGTCNPATGTCQGGVNVADGTACTADANACTTDACQGGLCAHTAIACAPGQGTCDPVLGCVDTVVANQSLANLDVPRVDGLAASGSTSFLSATGVFLPAKPIAGLSVAGAGASDVLLVRYDTTTGAAAFAKAYGDELDQFGKDSSAATADGTVAVVGRVAPAGRIGECTAGPPVTCSGVTVSNGAAFQADFLMLANAATGVVRAGTQVINNGISGQINAVAVNPTLNLVAVCGQVSATSSLCTTPGASAASCTAATTFQGGTSDLLVAVFNTAGVLQWARQVGSSTGLGDESCNAVAIDFDGTVWAAGRYNDELDLGTGPFTSLPNTTSVRHMWVGHFGATGATVASAAFGTTSPVLAGNVTPNDLELDSLGNLVVGGSFTVSFPVGSLASAGGVDAFVAKISPASLTGTWGVRLGNTGTDITNALAIGPFDSVIAVGSYAATVTGTPTTGAAALTAPIGTAGQAFVMKLNGATGATASAGGYGDASTQLATDVAFGTRVHTAGTYLGTLDVGGGLTLTNPATISLSFSLFSAIQ